MDELVQQVVDGEPGAWQALWTAIEPVIWAITARRSITGPLADRDDDRRDIVAEVMSRLRDRDFRRLRSYLESAKRRGSGSSFTTWLATVAARTAIDHVRAHPEYRDRRGGDQRHRWVRLVPVDGELGQQEPLGPGQLATATSMLRQARVLLDEAQLGALLAWLQGQSHAEIAEQLGLEDSAAARRVLRAALKRLRDRYREADGLAADPSRREAES